MATVHNGFELSSVVNIKAVGDICPGDDSIMGFGVYSKSRKYGADFPLRHATNALREGDLVIGNLEGVLATEKHIELPSELRFCGEPSFAKVLAKSGFTAINIANNHSFEYGSEIFLETVELLSNEGIQVCGLRNMTGDYYSMPVFLNIKGLEIGIIAYNWVGTDKFKGADDYIAQSHDSIVNYTWKRDREKDRKLQGAVHEMNRNVINDIRKMRQRVDLLILLAHWGFEFVHLPPLGVKLEARSFIDAGVDLIIGNHPHVLQGMEQYNNRHIFYSLGNFVFDARDKRARYSTILDFTVNDSDTMDYDFRPYYINSDFQPCQADNRQVKVIKNIIEQSTKTINTISHRFDLNDDDIYSQYERYYHWCKISAVYHLILAIKEDRKAVAVLVNKIKNFFEVVRLRFQGRKVRW